MKKVLAIGLLAICWIAGTQQEASAWMKSRFSFGVNSEFQSGGNKFGWGLFRNGQPPGPEFFGQPGQGFGHGYDQGFGHGAAPMPSQVAPAQQSYFAPMPYGTFDLPAVDPAIAYPSLPYAAPFQFATYPRPVYYYPAPYYYGR